MIRIDNNSCTRCNLCVDECSSSVLENSGDEIKVVKESYCIACGRCVAKCSSDAIKVEGINKSKLSLKHREIEKGRIKHILESKRSWRDFKSDKVSREVVEELISVAHLAPSAMNSLDRAFIVVDNSVVIKKIYNMAVAKCKGIYKLVKMMLGFPFNKFLPKETLDYFNSVKYDFETLINADAQGRDQLFCGAQTLVMFTGVEKDPLGKDNALCAMNYLMFYAEELGLGTCINGFTSVNAKELKKIVDVPRFHKVYGVVTLGYKKGEFENVIYRKEPEVIWV